MTTLRTLFERDVTRDIPPVVQFHEQDPKRLAAEVSEYIITGGHREGTPGHKRVPDGIHEQAVNLLRGIGRALGKSTPGLECAVWISGLYGSGKSSFAKLLGLALDGRDLPDGRTLADALIERDRSDRADELRIAWDGLISVLGESKAVVFDIGATARTHDPIHAVAARMVQRRLGYCHDPLVAEAELMLETAGEWERFRALSLEHLGQPWEAVASSQWAGDDFSLLMSHLRPQNHPDPTSWYASRAGKPVWHKSPAEVTRAIGDMLRFRAPESTLFIVIDEVSQYIHQDEQRMLALQGFVESLKSRLGHRVWLFATGQQALEQAGDRVVISKMQARFPRRYRVHLTQTNIRDVVHQRLLKKTDAAAQRLRTMYREHDAALRLFAYGSEDLTEDDFVETYPLLPRHIELIGHLTTALRRSSRGQGDAQAVRGVLQLVGDLFARTAIGHAEPGALLTLDLVYDLSHTSLSGDVQAGMTRILERCAHDADDLKVRVAKTIALLQLIHDLEPPTAELVTRCLYDRLDRGDRVADIEAAIDVLLRQNLLAVSEKTGLRIQSPAGEEWARERDTMPAPTDQVMGELRETLRRMLPDADQPKLQGRPFPWAARFDDGRYHDDEVLVGARDDAAVTIDLRIRTSKPDRDPALWQQRTADNRLHDRIVWVSGPTGGVEETARNVIQSRRMVRKYENRVDSLTPARRELLGQERSRAESHADELKRRLARCMLEGALYFRGRPLTIGDFGNAFATVLEGVGAQLLPELYPHFVPTVVSPRELNQLLQPELAGPSSKFMPGDLGLLATEAGRYVPSCAGDVPRRILQHIEREKAIDGQSLIKVFAGPPNGYERGVIKAALVALLRASKVKLTTEAGVTITAVRDPDTEEVFTRDRTFRRSIMAPTGDDAIGRSARGRIARFFEEFLDHRLDREDNAIADAVDQLFPRLLARLRATFRHLERLAEMGIRVDRTRLDALERALGECLRNVRQTHPTVVAAKNNLDRLRDGVQALVALEADVDPDALDVLRGVNAKYTAQRAQLAEVGELTEQASAHADRIAAHFSGARPWLDLDALQVDVAGLDDIYTAMRRRMLADQEAAAESARERIKKRQGFATLDGDERHRVLRPITEAASDTPADVLHPTLTHLRDSFTRRLADAEDQANRTLDALIEEKGRPPISRVPVRLTGLEIRDRQALDKALAELRLRIEARLEAGEWVRLTD